MYRCLKCGLEFEEPRIVRESRGEYWGAPAYEDYPVCPACGGDFVQVHKCKLCDGWTDDVYCPDCMTSAKMMLVQLFERLELDLAINYKEATDLAWEAFQALEG